MVFRAVNERLSRYNVRWRRAKTRAGVKYGILNSQPTFRATPDRGFRAATCSLKPFALEYQRLSKHRELKEIKTEGRKRKGGKRQPRDKNITSPVSRVPRDAIVVRDAEKSPRICYLPPRPPGVRSKLKARRRARPSRAESRNLIKSARVRATYKVNYYYLRGVIEERTIRFSGGQPTAGLSGRRTRPHAIDTRT